jgi:hypothetical protein
MGLPGVSGTSGTSGATGTSGTSGQAGTSGTSGATGTSGTSGISGTSGSSGVSATVTINNNIDNYVVTATGTTNTLNGEQSLQFNSTNNTLLVTGSVIISGSGLRVTGSASVLGSFTATTKSFLIDHQRFQGKKLIYGVLEGPEHGVYARGRLVNGSTIQLPLEWDWLVDEHTITVHLTSIGTHQDLYVKSIEGITITIGSTTPVESIDCYYIVHAMRRDVDRLETVV